MYEISKETIFIFVVVCKNHLIIWTSFIQIISNQQNKMAQRTSVLRSGKAPVQDPTQLPPGLDTTTYFFPAIPTELKPLIPLLHSTPLEHVTTCLQAVVTYLQLQNGGKYVAIDKAVYASMSSVLSMEDTNLLLTGLYFILRIAIRNKVKLSVVKTDLLKMNVPKEVVDLLTQALRRSRLDIESHVLTHRIQFHKLEKVRWRIDVVISTGSLSRVMKPSILMQVSGLF